MSFSFEMFSVVCILLMLKLAISHSINTWHQISKLYIQISYVTHIKLLKKMCILCICLRHQNYFYYLFKTINLWYIIWILLCLSIIQSAQFIYMEYSLLTYLNIIIVSPKRHINYFLRENCIAGIKKKNKNQTYNSW